MPSPVPSASNGYLISFDTKLNPATLNAVLGSVHERLQTQEAKVADYEAAIAQVTEAGLEMIAENVGPQLQAARNELTALQQLADELADQIAEIRNGGVDAVNVAMAPVEGLDATQVQAAVAELLDKVTGAVAAETEARNQAISALPRAGQRSFVASGALPNGVPVVLNDDGTVSAVAGIDHTISAGVVFEPAAAYDMCTARLTDGKFVVFYRDVGNVSAPTAVVGSLVDGALSFGAPAVLAGLTNAGYLGVDRLSETRVIITLTVGSFSKVVVGTVAGSAITFGTPVDYSSNYASNVSLVALNETTAVIVRMAPSDGAHSSSVISISGTTPTLSGGPSVNSAAKIRMVSLGGGRALIAYSSYSGGVGRAVIGTVTGSTLTLGSEANFSAVQVSILAATLLEGSKALVAYSTSSETLVRVVDGSGASPIFGAAKSFFAGNLSSASSSIAVLSPSKFCIVYSRPDGRGVVTLCEIRDGEILVGDQIVFKSTSVGDTSAIALASPYVHIAFRDAANSNYGTGVTFRPQQTNMDDWLGLSAADIDDDQPGLITLTGGVAEGLSGLLPGAPYYIAPDGALTTEETRCRIGRALSSSSLLIGARS